MTWRDEIGRRSFSPQGRIVVGITGGSHFLNHMHLVLLPPIFGLLATEFDASLTELGFAVSAMSLFSAVFQLPFGYVSDNYSRTLTLVIGLACGAVGVFVIAMAESYTILLAGQALVGTGIAAHHPAHYPLLSDATREDNRGWAFSVHDVAGHLGYGAAPVVIIAVMALPGRGWRDALLLVAAIGAVYTLITALVLSRTVANDITQGGRTGDGATGRKPPLRERARAGLASLVRSPAVLALTALALIASMAAWGLRSFTVVLLTDGYGYGLSTANTALTLMFVGSAAATLVSGPLTDRLSAPSIIVPAYAALVVAAVTIGTMLIPPVVAAVGVIVGASAHSMGNPPQNRLLDRLSVREELGVNFATVTVGITLGGAVAPPIFGGLIDLYGFWAAFYLIAGFAFGGAAIVLAIARVYDFTPTGDPTVGTGD